ncbi:hypothetical protein EV183_003175 [Coemansia sp. RSA 2336]|nr:hypothetical protein EV183_003175 [Coemansia sp. RSA 2336]
MDETAAPREEVLRLILCQLSAYGYANLSQAVAAHTKVPMTADSNSRLAELVALGLQSERQQTKRAVESSTDTAAAVATAGGFGSADSRRAGGATVPGYQLWYKTKHKGVATMAAFSKDGRYIATGSADASLKLIEVDRVRSPSSGSTRREDKPVIRTMYHHDAEITGLAFHPNGLVLASCSADRSVKLFDISAAHGKHSFQSFADNYAFRSIAFHPSGDYLAAGSDAHEVRLYSVRTAKAYLLSAGPEADRHSAGIAQVAYSGCGKLVVSASGDGSVKLWDAVGGRCVRTIARAHDGRAATAVSFSRNSKHILTTGRDSSVRLWETGSGRLVQTYSGAGMDMATSQAVLSHDEALVLAPDSRTNSVACWDAHSARLLAHAAEHSQPITWIAASPSAPAFMSCSTDECVRYWSADA